MIRLLIVGESSVGKTSLLIRFNEGNFYTSQRTTIGVDYKAKEIDIDGETIKLQIWDTAGQERFRSMTSAFYSKAQGIVIVFDITNRESFKALPSWIRDIREKAPINCALNLCANKFDLPPERWATSKEEFEAFAKDYDMEVIQASASTGSNVNEVFVSLGRTILSTNRAGLAQVETQESSEGSLILKEFAAKKKKKQRSNDCCLLC